MTIFELAIERNEPLDIADAIEAFRLLDAEVIEIIRVTRKVSPVLAKLRLLKIVARRQEIRKRVEAMFA